MKLKSFLHFSFYIKGPLLVLITMYWSYRVNIHWQTCQFPGRLTSKKISLQTGFYLLIIFSRMLQTKLSITLSFGLNNLTKLGPRFTSWRQVYFQTLKFCQLSQQLRAPLAGVLSRLTVGLYAGCCLGTAGHTGQSHARTNLDRPIRAQISAASSQESRGLLMLNVQNVCCI